MSSHDLLVYKQPLPNPCLNKTHIVFVSMNLCLLIGEKKINRLEFWSLLCLDGLIGTFQRLTGTYQPRNSINVAVFMIVCVRQESLPLFHLLSFGLLLLLLRGLCQVQAELKIEEEKT